MPTKVKKKNKVVSNKKRDKYSEYYESVDLKTWWEQFHNTINDNGTNKYKTIWSFITAKAKEKWQRDFLWWILGPINQDDKTELFSKFDRFNWEEKREKGFWYNSARSGELAAEVKKKASALDMLREVGGINIKFIERLGILAEEIDREFLGRLFLPNLKAKENAMRADMYFGMMKRLQNMLNEAQIMFGRTQGLDLERLDQFFSMFAKGIGDSTAQHMGTLGFVDGQKLIEAESNTKEAVSADNLVSRQIARMVMDKAAQRGIDLPSPEMEAVVLDAANLKLVKR